MSSNEDRIIARVARGKNRPKDVKVHHVKAETTLLDLDAIAKKSAAGDFMDDEVIDQLVAENRRLRTSLTEVSDAASNAIDWLRGPMVGHDEAIKQLVK
jgi:hypothetical protein